jgi:transposase InsO family protein
MAKDKPPTYTPAPELPNDPSLRQRFMEIVAVLAQIQTVSAAARSLDLSRNHFQTILHRVIAAMIDAMTPKPAGRPAKPEREAELEAELERLRAENEALTIRTEAIERMLKVVGGYASGTTPLPRSRGKKTKSEDPEPARIRREAVKAMREQGVPTKLCVAALGVSPSTVRRCAKVKSAPPKQPKPRDPAACNRVRSVVRATHGLVGATNLGKMSGLPRRTCAEIKRRELRELELERKARCATVSIVVPGVVRGFDAMHVDSMDGKAYWLVAADASIPYRTSITTVPTYDAEQVMAALVADFEAHGPPLVLRLDRIACQRTTEVEDLLTRYQVLALHGPPRHPYYYGQLERQNREHRSWYDVLGRVSLGELARAGEAMRRALNTLWPRPTLDGWTAEQAWRARSAPDVSRRELITEVERRVSGLVRAGVEKLHARRIAIESALTQRGLLTINQGGWC